MKNQEPNVVPALDVLQMAIDALARLLKCRHYSDERYDELHEVRLLLEAMPLASGEFGVLCNRLRNATRYLHASEHGAARWELTMVLDSLRHEQDELREHPRRRLNRRYKQR